MDIQVPTSLINPTPVIVSPRAATTANVIPSSDIGSIDPLDVYGIDTVIMRTYRQICCVVFAIQNILIR